LGRVMEHAPRVAEHLRILISGMQFREIWNLLGIDE